MYVSSLQWLTILGAFSDPGSVPSNATYLPDCTGEDRISFCPKCDAYKPPRAHHCSTCNRCIVRMDHHCPWTNNCIGYRNMKYFVLFLAYTMTMCIYTFFMVAARLYFVYRFAGEVDDTNSRSFLFLTSLHLSIFHSFFCNPFTSSGYPMYDYNQSLLYIPWIYGFYAVRNHGFYLS